MKNYKMWLLSLLLIVCCFGTARGDTVETIFESNQSQSPAQQEWKFNVAPFATEHQVRLSLDARIDWASLAGSNPWMRVAVNGNFLTKDQLLNKRSEFKMQNGSDLTWVTGDRWRVLYSPDFEAAIKDTNNPMAAPNDEPYHFVWDITPFVKPGENVLKIYNLAVIPQPTTLILRDAQVEVGKAIAPPPAEIVTPAPTGALPTFVAQGSEKEALQISLAQDGSINLQAAQKYFSISTSTSLPDGKWYQTATDKASQKTQSLTAGQSGTAHWKTAQYDVNRAVKVLSDHVHISDTFTNITSQLIGIIIRHHLQYPSPPASVKVAGRPAQIATPSELEIPEHPSVFAQWPDMGLALIAEDDVFRVHVKSYNDADGMGIADEQLGIAPGASVTLEWNIYPTPKTGSRAGDYWDFVNAVRRDWGSNITVPGPFAFVPRFNVDDPMQDSSKPAQYYADWVRKRGLKILAGNIGRFPDAKYAHGTAILSSPQFVEAERKFVAKLHSAAPDVKYLSYFHAQLSTEPNAETKYADSRLLDSTGKQLNYPYAYKMPLYLPTLKNSYGKALWNVINADLDTIKADGLYWDEMNWSMLRYADSAPWDNHTVIIDPQTHAVVGKRSNVTLLMQPLQLSVVDYLRAHGKSIIANTEPITRTMLNQKIPRFVETQSYSSLINTRFGTPIGFGNHIDEKGPADTARQIRDMLGYGALYYADTQYKEKTPPAWPFVSVMFPITPVELRAGMVLGKERIQTAISGNFGWPDGAAADVYVIDGDGNRVSSPQVKDVGKNGKHLYEIRMPSDHFAVLVKKN